MKSLITNYTFDASAQTITFGDYAGITLDNVMLITNVTDQVIIYNFADSSKGGSVATNVLTLEYDTTSMSDTDDLQIWYWDPTKTSKVVISDGTDDLPVLTDGGGNYIRTAVTVGGTAVQNPGNNSDDQGAAATLAVTGYGYVYDGSAWDRQKGDSTDGTLVNLGTNNDVVISDGGGAITVDGTVAVTNAGITTIAGAVSGTEMQVDVVTLPGVAGDVAAAQADSGNPVKVGAKYNSTKPTYTNGQRGDLEIGTRGALRVEIWNSDSAVALGGIADNADDIAVSTSTNKLSTIAKNYAFDGTAWDRLRGDATDGLLVNLGANNDVTITSGTVTAVTSITNALPAGTNAIGKLAANSGVDIGDVDVLSLPSLPAGTNAIGKLAANSGVDIGDVDITSIVSGTGATNLGKAEDNAHTSGDVGVFILSVRNDTPNATLAAAGDYQQVSSDMVGGVRTALYETDFAVLGTNHVKKYYTNAGAVTDGIVWSPAAGKRWYVTDIFINVSAAATVTLEDDLAGGDSAVWKAELAANSGWSHHFGTPLFSGEDEADLIITTSAGNVYVTVTGYEV